MTIKMYLPEETQDSGLKEREGNDCDANQELARREAHCLCGTSQR